MSEAPTLTEQGDARGQGVPNVKHWKFCLLPEVDMAMSRRYKKAVDMSVIVSVVASGHASWTPYTNLSVVQRRNEDM